MNARYVLGPTATPVRCDSQQPVMFMLCGPIWHVARAGYPRDFCTDYDCSDGQP
jgi:superfamily II DNA or RNA helicase